MTLEDALPTPNRPLWHTPATGPLGDPVGRRPGAGERSSFWRTCAISRERLVPVRLMRRPRGPGTPRGAAPRRPLREGLQRARRRARSHAASRRNKSGRAREGVTLVRGAWLPPDIHCSLPPGLHTEILRTSPTDSWRSFEWMLPHFPRDVTPTRCRCAVRHVGQASHDFRLNDFAADVTLH